MKNSYLLLALLAMMNMSFAQHKSSGVVTLHTGTNLMTIQIDLNQATSLATITMVGPSTRWFTVGYNATQMTANTDCFTSSGTSVFDQFLPGGHQEANFDTTDNLTTVSNIVNGNTRTVTVTRPFNTNDSEDYTFNFASNSLNIIWAYGPSNTTDVSVEHSSYGTKNLSFATLGTSDFTVLDQISVYPNPSKGLFTISKNSLTTITKVRIFDTNAKLLKEISPEFINENNLVDLSELSSGMYFMEISNETEQTVKKIIIN